jgi:hypothetical protein
VRLLTVLVVLATTLVLSAATAADSVRRRAHDPGCRSAACDHRIDAWLARRYRAWRARYLPTHQPWSTAVASWFDDGGATACGTHYLRGLASRTLGCGTPVHLCFRGCEVAYVEDRGPFVDGRLFDLNAGAREAISCTDLCGAEGGTLSWYVR